MAGSCSAASSLAHVHYVIRNPHLATTSTRSPVSTLSLSLIAPALHLQLTSTRAARMFAARSRAVCAARQLQRTSRTYASDAHGHGHGHHSAAPVNESFGVRIRQSVLLRWCFGGQDKTRQEQDADCQVAL